MAVKEKQDSGLLGTLAQSGRQQGGSPGRAFPDALLCSGLCSAEAVPSSRGHRGVGTCLQPKDPKGPRKEGEGVTLLL